MIACSGAPLRTIFSKIECAHNNSVDSRIEMCRPTCEIPELHWCNAG